MSSRQQVVRYDRESCNEISKESEDLIIASCSKIINSIDIILLSDYGKGVLTSMLIKPS